MKKLLLVPFALLLASTAHAQDRCVLPPNFNPYTDPVPTECRSETFVPYQVATGEFKPTAFIFTGGALNPETLAYLDILNSSAYAQRVNVEYQVLDRTVFRTYVLPPKQPLSIDVGADDAFRGATLSFSVTVTFERLGVATLTLRPAASPWSSAITPTPRIVDLPAVTKP